MKDLLETTTTIALAIALIATTYLTLGAWLTSLITGQFDNLAQLLP
jgi:hypothetical protein